MAGLFGGDDPQGGLLGIDPYSLATIAQLFGAKKGDNYGLNIANIESQRQAAMNRAQQAKVTQLQVQEMMRQQAMQRQKDALASQSFAPGVQPLTPNDDQGNPMPSSPGGGGFQAYAQGLMQIDPQAAMQMQAQLAALNQKARVKVGAGETVGSFEGDKFVPAFSAPEKAPPGFHAVNGQLVADPAWLEAQIKLRQAGRPQTSVSVNTGENPFQKKFGEGQATDFFKLRDSATKAAEQLQTVNNMREAMDQGMFQGGGASAKAAIVNWLQPMGWTIGAKDAEDTQKFNASAGKFLLQHAKELGSNPSNADAARIDKIIGSADTNPNAMAQMLEWQDSMMRRSIQNYNSAYEQIKKNPNTFNAYDMSVTAPEPYQSKGKPVPQQQGPLKKNMTETFKAQQAIKKGADPEAVRQRMRENGFDDSGL